MRILVKVNLLHTVAVYFRVLGPFKVFHISLLNYLKDARKVQKSMKKKSNFLETKTAFVSHLTLLKAWWELQAPLQGWEEGGWAISPERPQPGSRGWDHLGNPHTNRRQAPAALRVLPPVRGKTFPELYQNQIFPRGELSKQRGMPVTMFWYRSTR